ncbi:hypothetical protein MSG28_006551 [Choristoneura fumiferana]|uniref:Uncharacterized protein n=1 Tax=Choristoneura fumiferana TaxID=7141 RepID=A0ACC0JFG5_CHOFU|nr:hypothetical protein MSG28_006551 [Choristoneura fumiferana]
MNSGDDVLSFMDLLDLDEELVDERLKTIMVRENYSHKHLKWAIQLLKYKQLINNKEEIDCENNDESDFVAKLIKDLREETADNVCQITNIVLNLNPSSIISKSEHLLQQILLNIDVNSTQLSISPDENTEGSSSSNILLNLRLCDTILDAVIKNNEKLYMPFLETPLEQILLNPKILDMVSVLIMERINKMLVNKCMYHGNSQPHRTLMNAVQHLLLILLLKQRIQHNVELEKTANWCMDLLGKMPHQPSVRICLEWYIALHFYMKKQDVDEDFLTILKSKKIPLASQFIILYWIVKHKIINVTCKEQEFKFVMAELLSHTMGQTFVVRLQAQFLAAHLSKLSYYKPKEYEYVIKIIENTFYENRTDKNFVKLQKDYFANDFDIVTHLTPCFIYYFLPRYCEMSNNENVDVDYLRNVLNDVEIILSEKKYYIDDFIKEWAASKILDEEIFKLNVTKSAEIDEAIPEADIGTIQKKYVPWKNMSDIDVYEITKKRESPSDLIVVASLIDKLPNLGGMARTSEVFGVKTYVVDSLRHLHDKQFQGLSVSAERWVDIEEVRPGAPLKEYLVRKKREGYSVVAAEQTSTSCLLQSFKFPKKSLLLLGHEKEGIPCDLLPMMDYCVEIPQQGFVRSLNVHVTAAIFVWEYARQNFLC